MSATVDSTEGSLVKPLLNDGCHTTGRRSWNENLVPSLAAVSTLSELPIASRRLRQIANPSPALEKRIPIEPGRNPSNSIASTFSGIPRPVSLIQNSTISSDVSVQPMETEPESV